MVTNSKGDIVIHQKYKKKTKGLYIFIVLFSLYFAQGILYPVGTFISQILLLLLLIWGFVSMIKTIKLRQKPSIVRIFTFFSLMLIVTWLVSPKIVNGTVLEMIGKVRTFAQFKDEMGFCLMFFIGFNISKFTHATKNTFLIISIILTFLSVVNFTYTSIQLSNLTGREENTVNTAYNFVSLLPLYAMAFKNHPKAITGILFICVFYVILGAKRGAIVCLCASLLYGFYWYNHNYKLGTLKRVLALFLILGLFAIAYYWYTQNEYLVDRVSYTEENGIGMREIGYAVMFNHWINDKNILSQLFGNGTSQTINVWGNYGHNDWLELLIDNGLLGVSIYALVFVFAFYFVIKKISDPILQLTSFLCVIIWFLKTCFSMGYTDLFSGIITFVLGYCIRKSILNDRTHKFYKNIVTYDSGKLQLR